MSGKKLSIPCDFGQEQHKVDFYVGEPRDENHPIQNQSGWLSANRGGMVPSAVMESLKRIFQIAVEQKVPFAPLCEYAVNLANGAKEHNAKSRQSIDKLTATKSARL